jgi:hypothetical protein
VKNIFVFGADDFNLTQMPSLEGAQNYRFHELLRHREVKAGPDTIWLLEINTRISKSHCPLFRRVDGASHHQVMLDLALSSSYFPLAWPPQSTRLTIYTGCSRLILPTRRPREETIVFPSPQASAAGAQLQIERGHHNWRLEDIDLIVKRKTEEWYTYQGDEFESPRGETRWQRRFERGDWSIETITRPVGGEFVMVF